MLSRRAFLASAAAVAAPAAPVSAAFVRVSPRDRRYLELSDGSPYIPIGPNLIAPPGRDPGAGLKTYEGWSLVDGTGPRAFVPPDHPDHPDHPKNKQKDPRLRGGDADDLR